MPPSREDDEASLSLTVLMMPDAANFAGNVHGGYLLKCLDQVAYTCASRFTRQYTVTAAVDRVWFRQTVHIGELVTFLASVNHTGRSSLEVGIRVDAENVTTGVRRHTTSCYFVMVALGEDLRPCPIRPMTPETDEQKRRWREAEARRSRRLEEST